MGDKWRRSPRVRDKAATVHLRLQPPPTHTGGFPGHKGYRYSALTHAKRCLAALLLFMITIGFGNVCLFRGVGRKREAMCWICVVEVGIWRFSCLRKLVPMARGYGLRNVINFYKAMEEMYRVLKPRSKVSILDFNKSTNTFSASIQLGFCGKELVVGWEGGYVDCQRRVGIAVAADLGEKRLVEQIDGLRFVFVFCFEEITLYSTAGKELEKLALEVGFENSKHYEIGGGLMGNLVATR
ncbi:hypothetical protein Vadar_024798 [Vaccinium darrowii]|uniref:Uncharacterized protein n=1 Tax=Vaccinium darrowii TaxID=229202 RepID=A0ACB7XKW7_9ERIC|nr:hypothetical protein Vadar_024798 [Vaccinium darrowii]